MWKRLIGCVVLLGGLLALPFYFRREDEAVPAEFPGETDHLVIVSAHNKAMRDEYDTAFRNYYRKRFNRDVILDFRSPGGTSDIIRYIDDRFVSEFRNFFESNPGNGKWKKEYTDIFRDSRSAAHPVRKLFMASDVGIGIDIFAGGGTFNHARLAKRGYGVDAGVMKRHPEYFSDKVIPGEFGGDRLYDPAGRYYGVVLSTFGIFCNLDRIREMGLTKSPETWKELGNAEFFDLVVLADPSKSGSANKCYEIIIQQAMAEAGEPSKGWDNGLNLLKKIFANARTITDSASQVVSDVACGEAAAGMAIDTYGFAEVEWSRRCFGEPHVRYITPRGGTAVSSDPVMLLRGAPNRKTAEAFIDFLLSEEGQKLHAFKMGTCGGGIKSSLSRPAIRKDIYEEKYRKFRFEPDYNPYASGADFTYRPEWTGRYYMLLQMLIKTLMLEPHEELQRAWKAIIAAGGPEKVPEAMREFNALPFAYSQAGDAAGKLQSGAKNSAVDVSAYQRSLSDFARKQYLKAEKLAKEGR